MRVEHPAPAIGSVVLVGAKLLEISGEHSAPAIRNPRELLAPGGFVVASCPFA